MVSYLHSHLDSLSKNSNVLDTQNNIIPHNYNPPRTISSRELDLAIETKSFSNGVVVRYSSLKKGKQRSLMNIEHILAMSPKLDSVIPYNISYY